jgi:hypothetical protein
MKTYPLFALLEDRACLVVGGGAVGERKVQDLLQGRGPGDRGQPGPHPATQPNWPTPGVSCLFRAILTPGIWRA